MPSTTLIVDRRQREPLYRHLTQRISGIGDVYVAIVQGDYATAERLSQEFAEDMRMLDDLGWDPDDRRSAYELTMPRDELVRALPRLKAEAEDGLSEPEEVRAGREEDEGNLVHYGRVREVCLVLIADLDSPTGSVA